MSKQRRKNIEAKSTICFLFFHLELFLFLSLFCPEFRTAPSRCRLPLCTCTFGFRATVHQRPTIKVRSHSPKHHSPNPSNPHPTNTPGLLPLPEPSNSPCKEGASMTRGHPHSYPPPPPPPPPLPAPQSCMHVSFVPFVSFFCFVLYFFVK